MRDLDGRAAAVLEVDDLEGVEAGLAEVGVAGVRLAGVRRRDTVVADIAPAVAVAVVLLRVGRVGAIVGVAADRVSARPQADLVNA